MKTSERALLKDLLARVEALEAKSKPAPAKKAAKKSAAVRA